MKYYKRTSLINEDNEELCRVEEEELTAEEMIDELTQVADQRLDTGPTPKRNPEPAKGGKVSKKKTGTKPGKEHPWVQGEPKKGKKKTISDAVIYEVLDLKKEEMRTKMIAEKVGISEATVYRITAGHLKPDKARGDVLPGLPEAPGERDIDREPVEISKSDWDEMKSGTNDGLNLGAYRISMPLYDLDEMQRAMEFPDHDAYVASRKKD